MKTIPRMRTMTPPAAPIRLITAFAFERSGLGVTSGIKATAGDGSAGFDSKDSKTVLTTNTSITLTNGEGE